MSIDKNKVVLHQHEDGSLQLRDDISFMWCACGKPAVHIVKGAYPPHDFRCIKCFIEMGGAPTQAVNNLTAHIKTHPEMNETFLESLRIYPTAINVYAAQRIEELEFQNKTAGFRAVIEAYDRGGMESNDVYSAVHGLLSGFEKLPEQWMEEVAVIWCEWDEDFGTVEVDEYIDRIRKVIGMKKPRDREEEA